MRAVLSIGSNLDDRRQLLRSVVDDFQRSGELVAASPIYATPPWGVAEQSEFLNAVLIVEVDLTPRELLRRCQRLENEAGRRRTHKWGPRTLDVDIIQVHIAAGEEIVSTDPELILPHPWAQDRAFVLVPWLAVDPQARLGGKAVSDVVKQLPEEDVRGVVLAKEES
ncbi:2-amino-4-hydroxy-6-hydroxymethyldihydropteridine diphosphokinase [Corynebacterium poyangense]|uniref:2-amino-4-hydroxy-6-hydroxymethyldihydropteridine diphosphokinase n=1 Tax=Corynebacterium poyangense TaxID=2684405 RepID=A0A7H0SSK0_9CORY|nr:2-amino-4-hydroxy-6-hydroxymethyldihydropteridine diphosphokinase [Corynebacterium poyangense]QNQ91525.1 2-amino-4-hydroxy-6-hydroxymethyldihydropteridine diphosphokinase [Corynebacterium poyangense]